ncbi:DUF6476 family protein [Teichococcus oryzae]|uniref:Uncharacterized protein n=1 Tax=Teichococcus oryzae TaxID=1608942 RepID=A0A5B2TE41_9PROT|nr:DUF6476 family protein [Pseudoroseomonas oryzae]KAA2212776.1 hypothetical protein F0Q34_13830 [Pseudoroseomonas oryzae]
MRGLKILVAVMGVLIIIGTVGLVVGIVQKLNTAALEPAAETQDMPLPALTTDLELGQPSGTRIGGIAALQGRLAVWVERPDGARILMVDPNGRQPVREIRLGQ